MKSRVDSDRLEPWLSEASDASPELRAFLREADAYPEDAARVERLRQRLGPWLAAASLPPAAPAPPGANALNGTTTLSAVGKACLLALGAGTFVAGGGLLIDSVSSSSVAPPARSVASITRPQEATPPPPAPARPEPAAPAAPIEAPRPRSSPSPSPTPPSLAEEAAELASAQRALAASPAQGLALLRQHAAKYPRGALAEERYVFTIEALVALSRSGDARRELVKLELGFPRSAHLGRARRLVGIEPPSQ